MIFTTDKITVLRTEVVVVVLVPYKSDLISYLIQDGQMLLGIYS